MRDLYLETCVKHYYQQFFEHKGALDAGLFTPDFRFKGPLLGEVDLEHFLKAAQLAAAGFYNYNLEHIFVKDPYVATFYEVSMGMPPMLTKGRCAELFTFSGDRIQRIEVIYDPAPWQSLFPKGK